MTAAATLATVATAGTYRSVTINNKGDVPERNKDEKIPPAFSQLTWQELRIARAALKKATEAA